MPGVIAGIFALGLLGAGLNSIGAFGAYKEHYGLTLTFAILALLGTVGSLGAALKGPTSYPTFLINLAITILAFSFAHDCNKLKLQQLPTTVLPGQYPAIVTIVGPPGSGGSSPPPLYTEKDKKLSL
ncbi:unnamed protein product [Medioppia subpectinata]|uniref:Uncharacterized protein n=1 Tax=Medioppia subpectinata TaxID=1979941 RepID=A0A7R9PVS1_9ACAR|nr:unnamed protein product [Medioppia subpectinata]CAG2102963.1 unnamed protein product [Medioppia subpectinata]